MLCCSLSVMVFGINSHWTRLCFYVTAMIIPAFYCVEGPVYMRDQVYPPTESTAGKKTLKYRLFYVVFVILHDRWEMCRPGVYSLLRDGVQTSTWWRKVSWGNPNVTSSLDACHREYRVGDEDERRGISHLVECYLTPLRTFFSLTFNQFPVSAVLLPTIYITEIKLYFKQYTPKYDWLCTKNHPHQWLFQQ